MNIITNLELVSVESSQISAVGYSEEHKTLAVEFIRNNSLYYYSDVEKKVFEEMIEAESVGKFFAANVRDKYEYEKIR